MAFRRSACSAIPLNCQGDGDLEFSGALEIALDAVASDSRFDLIEFSRPSVGSVRFRRESVEHR